MLRSLPYTTSGYTCKHHIMLAKCISLIRIASYLRYGVVLLTGQALRTLARYTYPVDCSDKPRVWSSIGQKSHTWAYVGLIRECVTPP